MAIIGITYDKQGPTAADHGVLFGAVYKDGILRGCSISYIGAALTIAPGYICTAGRLCRLPAAETVTIDATSGYARVVLRTDLTQEATTEAFHQLSLAVQTAESLAALPQLRQDDINAGGTVYEASVAVVSLSATGISSVLSSMPRSGVVALSVELPAAGWVGLSQTVAVPAVGADSSLVVAPAPASHDEWCADMIRATAQADGSLTFAALSAPSVAVTANVLIVG